MEIDVDEKEISLFDLLLVAAENLKLLILGPLVVGLLAKLRATLGFKGKAV